MLTPNRLWFLLNWQAWAVLLMGAVATVIVRQPWLITLGIIGYLLVILFDIASGGNLGRSGAVRLARAEQENRELHAEQARLVGAINELKQRCAELEAKAPPPAPLVERKPGGTGSLTPP
jgi:hypothetical protein